MPGAGSYVFAAGRETPESPCERESECWCIIFACRGKCWRNNRNGATGGIGQSQVDWNWRPKERHLGRTG